MKPLSPEIMAPIIVDLTSLDGADDQLAGDMQMVIDRVRNRLAAEFGAITLVPIVVTYTQPASNSGRGRVITVKA
jgi:hypothetical protein